MNDYVAAKNNTIAFMLRQTNDNMNCFKNYTDLIRFSDFHDLDNILERMT